MGVTSEQQWLYTMMKWSGSKARGKANQFLEELQDEWILNRHKLLVHVGGKVVWENFGAWTPKYNIFNNMVCNFPHCN